MNPSRSYNAPRCGDDEELEEGVGALGLEAGDHLAWLGLRGKNEGL